ncbi:MAG: DUF5615 family PIN-like protein [Acidobacteriota bacterium]|nr:DUF5615 family PIN-like protein [Acidobacteriota bacterium]
MKVWIDAQFSPLLAQWLGNRFPVAALHVSQIDLLFASDELLLHSAEKAGAIVITRDREFAQLVKVLVPPPKGIWITAADPSLAAVQHLLDGAFERALGLLESGESLIELKSATIA